MSCCNFCTNIESKNNLNVDKDKETNVFLQIYNWCKNNIQYFLLGIGICQILAGMYLYAVKTTEDNFTTTIAAMFTSGVSHSSIASIPITKKIREIKFLIVPIILIIYILIINSYVLSLILNKSISDYRMTIIILIEAFVVTGWVSAITYNLSKLVYHKKIEIKDDELIEIKSDEIIN
jgi:hypothetical protein